MYVEQRELGDTELDALLGAAFAELVTRYGAEGRSQVQPGATYLVAVVEGQAVGCGALQAATEDSGEVKRMYVSPAYRGRGLARALLKALEQTGRDRGYRSIRLTTGNRQPEAIALYESSGYAETPRYGKYVDQLWTHCYSKTLT
ncbi:GNAT superfamily N-acetyltransferase [Hamadaea flava]|uniref:GNAT family N-acetyltransferase n=1 Tax=Hamadaea flava TaxID=1742688 RepID=A0ABV8M1C5_9ACTN|nr:GNAT family N-acetyltransferase [Hamadaea flava]MCP2322081.1 GNAT superfamily N-acetyltransferase [Hamadaea flava]